MRCHICNTQLSPNEIQWNNDHKDWDPCTTCLDAINDVFNDDTEEEIREQLDYLLELEYTSDDNSETEEDEEDNGDNVDRQ